MSYFDHLFLFFLCCLILLGCDQQRPVTSIENTITTVDTLPADSDNILEEIDRKTGVQVPTIWYSPRLLIQQLGDLENKIVANIGAGPYGYFSFELADEAKKVIAIDIDPLAIRFIDSTRLLILPPSIQDRLETRLVTPDDPKLRFEEVDIITVRETYAYLPNKIQYLKKLKQGMKDSGMLLIVDFKMRNLPTGPPQSEKVPLYQVEKDLAEAGYKIVLVDDTSFAYQYMIIAVKN
ncbi:MAG: methyltransferase domain-containing protein [Bacteroidota bacterium]